MSKAQAKKPVPEPSPSSSVILVSPTNQILLLHRVRTSTSFASAHVFPGGNLDDLHDGAVASPQDPAARHADGPAYRLAAVRECFEESGILLARGPHGRLVDVDPVARDEGRRKVHRGEVKFGDWLKSVGATADVGGLIPFTRWITPPPTPKRFTTQMYLYFLPVDSDLTSSSSTSSSSSSSSSESSPMIVPTPDGGVEHTSAEFAPPLTWLRRHHDRAVSMFPPQYFLLTLLARFFPRDSPAQLADPATLLAERRALLDFIARTPATFFPPPSSPSSPSPPAPAHPTAAIPWAEKIISPKVLKVRDDGYVVLGLHSPGAEVEAIQDNASGGLATPRGGLHDAAVVVNLKVKGGPWNLGVFSRQDALRSDDLGVAGASVKGGKL